MPAGLKIRRVYASSITHFKIRTNWVKRKKKTGRMENKGGDEYFIEGCLRMEISFQYSV